MQKLTERLKKQALALGFNLVGVVAAAPGKRLGAYLAWLEWQYQGRWGIWPGPTGWRDDKTRH